jgi:hypothetical protein
VLAGLVVAASAIRIVLARRMHAPVILCDEFIYTNLARNLAPARPVPVSRHAATPELRVPLVARACLVRALDGHDLCAGEGNHRLGDGADADPRLTEGAFLPAFVLAVFAIAMALERPSLFHQMAAFAAIVLAVGIRVQGIVLSLVIPTAALAKTVLDLRAGVAGDRLLAELRRLWPTAVLLAGGLVAYVVYKQIRGAPLATGLGSYQDLARKHYPSSQRLAGRSSIWRSSVSRLGSCRLAR